MGTDLDAIMSNPQPMAQIFFNSFGQQGALAIWAIIVLVQYMMGSSMVRGFLPLLNKRRYSCCYILRRFSQRRDNPLPSLVMGLFPSRHGCTG